MATSSRNGLPRRNRGSRGVIVSMDISGKVSKYFEPETLTDEIYHAIKKEYRIRIPKKDLRQLRKVTGEVVDKNK